MTYPEPWDTVDNADSQMARYPRNRDEERARAFSSSLFTNKNSHHHVDGSWMGHGTTESYAPAVCHGASLSEAMSTWAAETTLGEAMVELSRSHVPALWPSSNTQQPA